LDKQFVFEVLLQQKVYHEFSAVGILIITKAVGQTNCSKNDYICDPPQRPTEFKKIKKEVFTRL
jgi:hypothetical protein